MNKFIILFFSLFFFTRLFACELSVGNNKIELVKEVKGCEFPEGNKVDCAYFKVSYEGKTRTSSVVFRKNNEWKSFCLSAKEGKRELSPFEDVNIFLDCENETSEMKFRLRLSQKEKECKFAL